MSTILDEIVKRKRSDLVLLKKKISLAEFKKDFIKSERNFYNAFKAAKPHYILECKKASPSKGVIRESFQPIEIAKIYNHYASAISVLTDEPYFQGSFEYLKQIREVSDLPLLCKDFIIDEYQVFYARKFGADAILLILEILTDQEYIHLKKIAESLGMGVLTEVANEEQAERARDLNSPIVGINNRNLKDFSIDPLRAQKLATILGDVVTISESGISTHADIHRQLSFVQGFLIGTAVMKKDNIDLACRSLLFGQNKLCGVKSQEILDHAFNNGFTFVGFNFVETSKRFICGKDASKLKTPLYKVGVFQNDEIEKVIDYSTLCSLNAVQLHGKEDDSYISLLRKNLDPRIQIWKAITVEQCCDDFPKEIDLFVVDSSENGQFGGTGKAFDWSLIKNIPKDKILLAGGLGVSNIKEAMKLNFLGLDLNSKLEDENGFKSPEKIKQAFEQIKSYRG